MPSDPSLLAGMPLFASLSADTLTAFAQAMTVRFYRKGMYVFTEGELAEYFHFVVDGRLRVFRGTPGGNEQTLQVLERGELLNITSFVDGRPYPASAETLTDARVATIRTSHLALLVQAHGDLAWILLQQFARRLEWAQGRIYDLALRSATGRVVSALLQFAQERGTPDQLGRLSVMLPLTHREIGQLTGVSRETVTRTLGQLRGDGGLEWTDDGRLVLDPTKLEKWLRV